MRDTGALDEFRDASEIGVGVGPHSQAALLGGALLGGLLYEAGNLTDAARLLEDSYRLGTVAGGVDYPMPRYVTSARILAAQGDQAGADERLAEGARTAERLHLPRLGAAINNERIRLGIEIEPGLSTRLRAPRTIPRDDGIAILTAELDENSGIRLLAASDSADDREQACRRAGDLLAGIDGERRPLAALTAQLLLIETLMATGRTKDADPMGPDPAERLADRRRL
jgi:ATP/maltotriose-dependent transcriptional regulator MalT